MRKMYSATLVFFISILLLGFIPYSCINLKASSNSIEGNKKEFLIVLDTDIQGDWDDVGAMGMLHALADSGEIKILATVASNLSPLVVPCIDVINTYFGRPDIPIGSPKTDGVTQNSRELQWPDYLVNNYPHRYKSNEDAPDAVAVYREVLSKQKDSSVVIVSIGFLTNLKNLLLSEPDSFSSLSGRDLVAKKVKHWVAMAGGFPQYKETNVRRDSTSSYYVINNWPTPIIFSGFEIGSKVLTGLKLIEDGHENSPIRIAYAMSIPNRPHAKNGHKSWDQTALLVAVRGIEPYYSFKRGHFIVHSDGSNSWKDNPDGPHKHLVEKMSPDSVAQIIEQLMMHTPSFK